MGNKAPIADWDRDRDRDDRSGAGASSGTATEPGASADRLLRNNARVFTNFAMEHIGKVLEELDLSRVFPVNETYKTEVIELVRKVFDIAGESSPDLRMVYAAHLDNLRAALNHVVYISAHELFAAVQENVQLLRMQTPPLCLIVPQELDKSNMLATLLAATLLRPDYAGCMQCEDDRVAINTLRLSDCLLFDDCIYSGSQMSLLLYICRQVCPEASFYAVPAFWHAPTDITRNETKEDDLHPAVRSAIVRRSRKLRAASQFLDLEFWDINRGQRLTYLQTKQPDGASFPTFLWSLRRSLFKDRKLNLIQEAVLTRTSVANCSSAARACFAHAAPSRAAYGLRPQQRMSYYDEEDDEDDALPCIVRAMQKLDSGPSQSQK